MQLLKLIMVYCQQVQLKKIYKIPRTTQIKKKEQTQMQKIKTPLVRFQKKLYIQNFCTVFIFSVLSVAMEE